MIGIVEKRQRNLEASFPNLLLSTYKICHHGMCSAAGYEMVPPSLFCDFLNFTQFSNFCVMDDLQE